MKQHEENTTPFDLFIVGGGINGTGIARDAAGRGLSVFLCEKGDLAQGTSSASTKMIHGGLRYLEFYEFRLVREALHEREILLNSAPNIIWPMEFVLPHSPGLRSIWLVRLGLFLYDHLAKRKRLGPSYKVNLRESRFGKPLKSYVKDGFVYSDCWVEDSRLVIETAIDAASRGAEIHNYMRFVRAERVDHLWRIFIQDEDDVERIIYARYIVNAAGPGVTRVAKRIKDAEENIMPLRLVKGSHIVVPRLYDGEQAYILQHPDRRMVFVIPFEKDFTLIGTTDQAAHESELDAPKISEGEISYLLETVNMFFNKTVSKDDVQYTYSGIRPLFDDGSTDNSRVTRDYLLSMNDQCLSIYGGKITTFRRLAEEAVNLIISDQRGSAKPWTTKAVLPGGDINGSIARYIQSVMAEYAYLDEDMASRFVTLYGTRVHQLLADTYSLSDLGEEFGNGLYAREVDFLVEHEWARSAEDILFRRTRLGLVATQDVEEALQRYLVSKGVVKA